MVEYEEGGALVQQITAAMDQINGRALVNVQGSLRAYVLTPEVTIIVLTACDEKKSHCCVVIRGAWCALLFHKSAHELLHDTFEHDKAGVSR